MTQPNTETHDALETVPAEDEDGYRHEDLEVGSEVIYEGERHTVSRIGRSGIRLEDVGAGVREGGIQLIVEEDA